MSDNPRPAYVQFETRPMEDRDASLEAGHTVFKDVVFAIVTPSGTKDRLEKEAEAWLEGVKEGVQQERIPAMWFDAYSDALKRYRAGQEAPEMGTALNHVTIFSPAEVKNILNANIRTVEDMAEATEEAMARIGMGSRALKQKAEAWLKASEGTGKSAAEIEKLRQENNDFRAREEVREETLKELQAQVATLQAAIAPTEKVK
jgi:prophage DNA circulation protein